MPRNAMYFVGSITAFKILGFYSGGCEDYCLLVCSTVSLVGIYRCVGDHAPSVLRVRSSKKKAASSSKKNNKFLPDHIASHSRRL
jgi:hypothetical protein